MNDPLEAAGYTFHQNFFGPAADLDDPRRRRRAPVGRPGRRSTRSTPAGRTGASPSPAATRALELLLDGRRGQGPLLVVLGFRPTGHGGGRHAPGRDRRSWAARSPAGRTQPGGRPHDRLRRGRARTRAIIVKRDPGASIVWVSFLLLIVGLVAHVLPAAPARLGAARARRRAAPGRPRGPLRRPAAASSAGCSRTSWRGGVPPDPSPASARRSNRWAANVKADHGRVVVAGHFGDPGRRGLGLPVPVR